MNRLSSLKPRLWTGVGLALTVSAIYAASISFAAGADTGGPVAKGGDPQAASAGSAKKGEKPAAIKKLTGSELYAINCNRCHPERYPTEYTSAQWKTIMMHMRVRANL